MLAGMRDRGHAAVGVQLALLDRRPPHKRHAHTLQYSSTHLRPPPSRWLAGWLMAVKSTISVRAYPRAEAFRITVQYSKPLALVLSLACAAGAV